MHTWIMVFKDIKSGRDLLECSTDAVPIPQKDSVFEFERELVRTTLSVLYLHYRFNDRRITVFCEVLK